MDLTHPCPGRAEEPVRAAPVLKICRGPVHSHEKNEDRFCSFALQNLILAAHALGLGTCLIYQGEFVDPELMEKYYNIPTYMKVYCAVTLGYPDENPETPARMEVDEVTEFLGEIPNPDF